MNQVMDTSVDYRDIKYRQAGFDKYYEFHCVTNDCAPDIAVETWLSDDLDFSFEKRCTLSLYHGSSRGGPFETIIADKFPLFTDDASGPIEFFLENKKRLIFSPDCKYRKLVYDKFLYSVAQSVKPYGTLGNFISSCLQSDDKIKNYNMLKEKCQSEWFHWGRMGHWGLSESLARFIDAPIQAPTMEFAEGASHRSGWAFCVGRDDLIGNSISKADCQMLEEKAAEYISDKKFPRASFFTLETACCNFKRQYKGSRYGGCYIDEQHNDIMLMEKYWPDYGWLGDKYFEGREKLMPHSLLFEKSGSNFEEAYCRDWVHVLKDYGRIPRVEAYFNNEKQVWGHLKDMPFVQQSLVSENSLERFF